MPYNTAGLVVQDNMNSEGNDESGQGKTEVIVDVGLKNDNHAVEQGARTSKVQLENGSEEQLRLNNNGGGSGGSGGGGGHVTQLRMLLRMMMARCCCWQAGLAGQRRKHADMRRQPASHGAGRGGQIGGGSGEARILAPLGSHVLGPAPPSPPGGGARGLLASLAHRGALLVLLLLTGVLRSLYTCGRARLTTLDSLKHTHTRVIITALNRILNSIRRWSQYLFLKPSTLLFFNLLWSRASLVLVYPRYQPNNDTHSRIQESSNCFNI